MDIANLIAYLIAVAIPIFAIYLIYALDLFGTGKLSLVIICMTWGATFAFGLAYLINQQAIILIGNQNVVLYAAPIIEEMLKALVLIYLIQSPRFRYVVDSAIYGFGVGIGFAVVENIFYLSNYAGTTGSVALAISRVLTASLMHATASGMVGISLGRLRRIDHRRGAIGAALPFIGIGGAMFSHIIYNVVVNAPNLQGAALLIIATGLGLSGSVLIGVLIQQGIEDEKRRFEQTLGYNVGVSTGERKAVQQLGGSSIENIMQDLSDSFGSASIEQIRKLLVIQANIGILENNLQNTSASPRLAKAWEKEIRTLQDEVRQTRRLLGNRVAKYLQTMFPTNDTGLWHTINEEMALYDPTLIHTFDMFMRVSSMAESFTPEQLEQMAERLQSISIFKYVDPADLENLSRAIFIARFGDGERIFEKGDAGDAMYLIEQGQIRIFTTDPNGGLKVLRTFQHGDVVGDFAVLDGQPRSARAVASGNVRALVLRREVFMMFLQSRPQVMQAVLQVLSEKARYTTQVLENTLQWASQTANGVFQPPKLTTRETEVISLSASERTELTNQLPTLVKQALENATEALQKREQTLIQRDDPATSAL